MNCAYCDRVLICDGCGAEFRPASPEEYEAVSATEEAVSCPQCEQLLICHWCKTPYSGEPAEGDAGAATEGA